MTFARHISARLALPARDLLAGLEKALAGRALALFVVLAGMLVGWWIYVPVHELLHVLACELAGGTVTRLEIDALYGGELLARVLPFVVVGSEHAGQLTGFDTGGSDLTYLTTDLGPFALTLFPGVWAMRRAARSGRALLFGFVLPCAMAPFVSLTGDAYEIGSLAVVNVSPWRARRELLLSDDAFAVLTRIEVNDCAGFLLAAGLGIVWAFATYTLAGWIATRCGEPDLHPIG